MTFLLAVIHAVLFGILAGNLVYLRRGRRQAALPDAPRVSVLIPTRNEAGNLRRLLPSLLEQDYEAFEVVVYDDASEDDTWAVIRAFGDARVKPLQGAGPPPGWVGKVHALYQATRRAAGDLYLFLDADTHLTDAGALRRLTAQYCALPPDSVMTGLPRLRGGGLLLVSLVPYLILGGIPWPLVRRLRAPMLGALNGQCWMIRSALYHRHEPHANLPGEVLEDVQIGRYLKARGVTPVLRDVQDDVSVYMYTSFRGAWQGFRKNAYLIMGGRPVPFLLLYGAFACTYLLAPLRSPWLLLTLYALKGTSDRLGRVPLRHTLLAPASFLLASLLQLHSALSHWTGRVVWKGRRV